MACVNPLKMLYNEKLKQTKIIPRSQMSRVVERYDEHEESVFVGFDENGGAVYRPEVVRVPVFRDKELFHLCGPVESAQGWRIVNVPCGNCIGCRLDYSRKWADRLTMESLTHDAEKQYFITLTYDDAHLPMSECGFPTLYSPDLKKFVKDFRNEFRDEHVRFYACGEYGGSTARPHYHLLMFGAHLRDLKFYKSNFQHDYLFNSATLSEIWDKGFSVVGDVNWNTCAYTARYVMKKARTKGEKENYALYSMLPEFVVMSRRPGIGVQYFLDHKDEIVRDGRIYLPSRDFPRSCAIPRLFMDYLASSDPATAAALTANRRAVSELSYKQHLSQMPSLDETEYFENEEYLMQQRVRGLPRSLR